MNVFINDKNDTAVIVLRCELIPSRLQLGLAIIGESHRRISCCQHVQQQLNDNYRIITPTPTINDTRKSPYKSH